MEKKRSVFLMMACLLSWPLSASAQEPLELYRFEGPEVPRFWVVKSYFDILHFCYTLPDGGDSFTRALESIGVSRNSPGEGAVTRAMFLAQAVFTEMIDLVPYKDDPETLERIQLDLLRRQVHQLRKIYDDFLGEVEAAGGSIDQVETVLDEMVRPTVTFASTEPNPKSFLVTQEFDLVTKESDDFSNRKRRQ